MSLMLMRRRSRSGSALDFSESAGASSSDAEEAVSAQLPDPASRRRLLPRVSQSFLPRSGATRSMAVKLAYANKAGTRVQRDARSGRGGDRPGLRNTDLVQKIQKKLMNVLQRTVTAHHPENPAIFDELMKKIPDLRTLNTLHCEKLLAYKMEPKDQQQQQNGGDEAADQPPSMMVTTTPTSGLPPGGHCMGPVIPDRWYQFAAAMATSHRPPAEDDNRCPSSPGQQSQLSGGSSADWANSSDSKDGHEPFGSPRSVASSGISVEDGTLAKSPLRSSSAKSYESEGGGYCTQAVEQLMPFQPCNRNKRPPELLTPPQQDHGGCSSGDEAYATESPTAKVAGSGGRSPATTTSCPLKFRRIDSPTDSGVESGKEHGTSSTPTASVCSSPRSSLEEKVKDVVSDSEASDKPESIDDMPVLKRALQAPPLINTNMLMDEAYRHHKKFRAASRKDSSDSPPTNAGALSLASSHSTLVKTLEQAPRYMSEQHLKRTDLIHNIIMQTESPNPNWQPSPSPSPPNAASSRIPGFVPPPHQTTNAVGGPTYGNKNNVIVCPPGYYIPTQQQQQGVAAYSNSAAVVPTSWHLMSSSSSSAVAAATFVSNNNNNNAGQQAPPASTPLSCVPPPQQMAPSVSPHRVLVYEARSPPPSRTTSPLVIRTSPPPVPPPHLSPVCDIQTDTQPLNLSKRDTSSQPSAVKVES